MNGGREVKVFAICLHKDTLSTKFSSSTRRLIWHLDRCLARKEKDK